MASFVTLLAALAAITSPLVQAAPVAQAVANPQQDCAAALILAQGISENIEDQKNEKAALAQVTQVLQQTPVDANAFAAAKDNLLRFVTNGITIRQANQAIAPLGNKATAGLAIVANAQLGELNLTQGLTGDPAKDADAIQKLNDGFDGGLKQNQQNMLDAVAGCDQAKVGPPTNGTQIADSGNKQNGGKMGGGKKDAGKKDAGKKDAGQKDGGQGGDKNAKAGDGNAEANAACSS